MKQQIARLIKLIEDGTKKHAELATDKLSEEIIERAATDPSIIWDLLGRLQFLLMSRNWKSRYQASLCMERIASHLPLQDRLDFFRREWDERSSRPSSPTEQPSAPSESAVHQRQGHNQEHQWLTLHDVQDLERIQQHGRLLLSTSERTRYDEYEANELRQLDENAQHLDKFCEHRVQLQRNMLAKRLGLSGIIEATSTRHSKATAIVPAISMDDLLPWPKRRRVGEAGAVAAGSAIRRKGDSNADVDDNHGGDCDSDNEVHHATSLRALLVMESRRMRQSSRQQASRLHLHQNSIPQVLLANDLVFRMFSADWHERHGALLGIRALIFAWTSTSPSHATTNAPKHPHGQISFGYWLHDILSRCICVLALDRFGDFSGASISEESRTVVAPVREMAGQVFSTVLALAPANIRNEAASVIVKLIQQDTWEARHGGLIALRFAFLTSPKSQLANISFQPSASSTSNTNVDGDGESKSDETDSVFSLLSGCLMDPAEDVQGAAAQCLSMLQKDQSASQTSTRNCPAYINSLWLAISKCSPFSACITDLLGLLIETLDRYGQSCLSPMLHSYEKGTECPIIDLREDAERHLSNIMKTASTLYAKEMAFVAYSKFSGLLLGWGDARADESSSNHTKGEEPPTHTNTSISFRILFDQCKAMPSIFSTVIHLIQHRSFAATAQTAPNHRKWDVLAAWEELSRAIHQVDPDLQSTANLSMFDGSLLSQYFDTSRPPNCTASKLQTDCICSFKVAASVTAGYFSAAGTSFASSQDRIANVASNLQLALHSPFLAECAAACILYQALVVACDAHCPLKLRLQAHLNSVLEKGASCSEILRFHDPALTASISQAYMDLCSNNRQLYQEHGAKTESPNLDLVTKWQSAYQELIAGMQPASKVTTKDEMRINSLVAGCVALNGPKWLPPKISPLIRPLMTSVKNELVEVFQQQTADSVACLLSVLQPGAGSSPRTADDDPYRKSREKVITNLCKLLTSTWNHQRSTAARCIRGLLKTLPTDQRLDALSPICEHVGHIKATFRFLQDPNHRRQRQRPEEEDLARRAKQRNMVMGSLRLVEVIFDTANTHTSMSKQLCEMYSSQIVQLGCNIHDKELAEAASKCVHVFCQRAPSTALQQYAVVLCTMLDSDGGGSDSGSSGESQPSGPTARQRGCEMLRMLVTCAGVSIGPFIRFLLPKAMTLMTDIDRECAKIGASLFGTIVRCAPLASNQCPEPIDERDVASDEHSRVVLDHLILGKPLPPFPLPRRIQSALEDSGITLRSYQSEGIAWLRFLQSVNLNGALCDSMGLGKTLQALVATAISHDNENRTISSQKGEETAMASVAVVQQQRHRRCMSIVVCPSTLVGHWMNEIKRFFGTDEIFQPHSITARRRRKLADPLIPERAGDECVNIVVMSYATLRSEIDHIASIAWNYCILDEGHLLRNPKTATARATKRIRAKHRLVLTGTPVQNKVQDLWACFDFLMPHFLGSDRAFAKQYASPIAKGQQSGASAEEVINSMQKLKTIHQQVLPFILRRTKDKVLKELPPKSITSIGCNMSMLQAKLYKTVCKNPTVQSSLDALRAGLKASKADDASKEVDVRKLSSAALKALMFLRLICTHPCLIRPKVATNGSDDGSSDDAQFGGREASGKLVALHELLVSAGILAQIGAADNDNSLLYCDAHEDDEDNDEGGMSQDEVSAVLRPPAARQVDMSAKDHGSKCLIFAQFTSSLDVVEKMLLETSVSSVRHLRLDGQVPPEKRQAIVDAFNEDQTIRVLLLTTKVGGLGLNLTGADTVIFLEHDWNPHNDIQAMDRAHRIGQTKSVNVYKLITMDSIEETVMQIQQTKLAMSDAIVNTKNSSMFSMGTDRLLDIFTFSGDGGKGADDGLADSDDNNSDNLDVLFQRYLEDYATLSLDDFQRGLDGS